MGKSAGCTTPGLLADHPARYARVDRRSGDTKMAVMTKAACWGLASCLLAGVVTPAVADGYEAAERCYRAGDLAVGITLCSRAIRSGDLAVRELARDRKSTRLNSSH